MEPETEQQLRKEYGISQYAALTLIRGGTANLNYLVQSSEDKFILRIRNKKYSADPWITYEEEYLNYLKEQGIPVPTILANKKGELHTVIEDQVYQLTSFMEGSACNSGDRKQIAGSGRFLAKLHNTLADFVPTADKRLPRYDDPSVMLTQLEAYMEKNKQQSHNAEWEQLIWIKSQLNEIVQHIPDSYYNALSKVVIHGDYHPANVAYREAEICALFDFDWISLQPRVRDVVDGIIYFAGVRQGGIDGNDIFSLTRSCSFEWGRIRDFVIGYNQTGQQPLQPDEVYSIPYLMSARLINSRIQALAKISVDRHLEMLTAGLISPLLWIEENREHLIEEVRKQKYT
ncbi:Homoserine kinase [compost metagenome]